MKRSSKLQLVIGIVLIVLAVLIASVVIIQENRQNRENVVVEATVTSCVMTYEEYDVVDGGYDREYRIGVKYTYNGEEYESSIDTTSKKSVGKKIKIHIDPDNPIKTDGIYGGLTDYIATILFCAGPLALAGILLIVNIVKKCKREQQGE